VAPAPVVVTPEAPVKAEAPAQAAPEKVQQHEEVATQVAKHTPSKGDSAKGAKSSNNVG
jgi:hypothetical protein